MSDVATEQSGPGVCRSKAEQELGLSLDATVRLLSDEREYAAVCDHL